MIFLESVISAEHLDDPHAIPAPGEPAATVGPGPHRRIDQPEEREEDQEESSEDDAQHPRRTSIHSADLSAGGARLQAIQPPPSTSSPR